MLEGVAGVAHSITGVEQTNLNRECYFHLFGIFLVFKGSNYSELVQIHRFTAAFL